MTVGDLMDMMERVRRQEEIVQEMHDRPDEYFSWQIKDAEKVLAILRSETIDL